MAGLRCNALPVVVFECDGCVKMGASGCKAICSALERNTTVTDWEHGCASLVQ
jgi:hypothetical protein